MNERLAVEWTRGSLRMAVGEGRGRRKKLKVIRSLPLTSQELTPELIRQLHKALGTSVRSAVLVIPREQVITRGVRFPAVQPAELRQMVELYARAQLPYAREQVILDYVLLEQKEGFSTLAIVAIQRELVDRPIEMLRQAELQVESVTVSSWGVAEWYHTMPRRSDAAEPVLVIHIDDTRTDLVLMGNRRLLGTRSVGQGAQDWNDTEQVVELLAIEVERSRASLRKELPDLDVQSVLLTGLGPLPEWSEPLRKRLQLPVLVADSREPFVGWKPAPDAGVSPVGVGSVAVGDADHLLKLTPPELTASVSNRRQVKDLALIGSLLVAVIAGAAGNIALEVSRHTNTTSQMQQTIGSMSPQAKGVQEKRRLVSLVRGVLDHRRHLAGTMSSVLQSLPDGMSLDMLSFERSKNQWSVRGSCDSNQQVLDYVTRLSQVEGIVDVQLKFSRQRQTPSGPRTDFELVLDSPEKITPEKSKGA